MKRSMFNYAIPLGIVTALATLVSVKAGQLNPPSGSIAATNRVQLDAQTTTLPFTISLPGSYVLTSKLTGVSGQAGIIVAADNVTLDLNGFTLQGVAGSLDGIQPTGNWRSLTVVNGTISGWGGSGIRGYLFDGMNSHTVWNMRIEGVTATGNGAFGIFAGPVSVVRGCLATGNATGGIVTISRSIVENCLADMNTVVGIQVGEGTVVSACAATQNTGDGITAPNGESTIVNCTCTGNSDDGIVLGARATVRGCTVKLNGGDGIEVHQQCIVAENNALANVAAGVHVTFFENRIEANNVVANARGIDVDASGIGGGKLVIRNSARGNGINYDIVAGNTVGPTVTMANIAASNSPHANYDY